MTYGGFKDLPTRRANDEVLSDKAFNITQNPKYDGYKPSIAPPVFKFFNKQSLAIHKGSEIKHDIVFENK